MNIKNKELLRTLKFIGFSISAGVIQALSDVIFNELLDFKPWLSHLLALILSVLWNFTLNRKFTFQSAANVPVAMLKTAAFYVVFAPLSTWWTAFFTERKVNEYIVLACTMIVNFAAEYIYQRFFVFGKSIDTAKK